MIGRVIKTVMYTLSCVSARFMRLTASPGEEVSGALSALSFMIVKGRKWAPNTE